MGDPASDGIKSQLNSPQHEAAPQMPSSNQDASHVESSPEQSSPFPRTEDPAQPDTIKLRPPSPTARQKRNITQSFEVSFTLPGSSGTGGYSWSTETELVFCARRPRSKIKSQGMKGRVTVETPAVSYPVGAAAPSLEAGYSHTHSSQVEGDENSKYIVVGIMGNEESIPQETLRPITLPEDLFRQIREAERELRSPFRRLLSLKRVGGFGLYRCHPSQDYHSNPGISDETKRCLVELYRNYRTEKKDHQDRWMNWIHKNFNSDSTEPENGKYALQLLLRWSPLKLIIWSSIPVILSLVIGLWYMINPQPGEDHVAVVQTAWTISSYIVTTAALVLAIVASITQFGDV